MTPHLFGLVGTRMSRVRWGRYREQDINWPHRVCQERPTGLKSSRKVPPWPRQDPHPLVGAVPPFPTRRDGPPSIPSPLLALLPLRHLEHRYGGCGPRYAIIPQDKDFTRSFQESD
jgi:hypothetical protein